MRFNTFVSSSLGGIQILSLSILMASCGVGAAQDNVNEEQAVISEAEIPDRPLNVQVTLKTSDARVQFSQVFTYWGDRDVEGIGTDEITYTLEPDDDHGVECAIEPLRIITSNKAVIVPSGNICTTSPLKINISWPDFNGEPIDLEKIGFRWGLHEISPTEAFPFAIDRLSYSLPETDNIAMSIQCARDSRTVQFQFEPGANENASAENTPAIDIVSQDRRDPYLYRFPSEWTYVEMDGVFIGIPTVSERIDHPFFNELEKSTGFDLIFSEQDTPPLRIATKDDVKILKQFLQLCNSEQN